MDDRYGEKSTLIASQLHVSEWHQTLGDATLADAILVAGARGFLQQLLDWRTGANVNEQLI